MRSMPKLVARLVLISACVCIGPSQIVREAPRQIVFMKPIGGGMGPPVPRPGAIFEIAVMNLDGSGLRQLTNDGKFKFLPHFSPDAANIAYTKFSIGAHGDFSSAPQSATPIGSRRFEPKAFSSRHRQVRLPLSPKDGWYRVVRHSIGSGLAPRVRTWRR
jgi:hypothetical protein